MGTRESQNIQGINYQRTANLEVRILSEDSREVELSFSSEQPIKRWFGLEILCHDVGCMNLERLNQVGSLLFHHGRDSNYGSLPLGKITKAWVDKETLRGKAIIAFDTDEKSDLIYQKIRSGSLRGISVGYQIDELEEVAKNSLSSNGRFTGPCNIANRWTPYEISIEPVPADGEVGIGRAAEITSANEREGENMSLEVMNVQETAQVENQIRTTLEQTTDISEQVRNAIATERQRTGEITALCRDFGIEENIYINSGASIEEVRGIVLQKLKTGAQPLPASRVSITEDEEDKYRGAATSGLLMHMGFTPEKPADGAREFQGMSLRDLMIDCVARSGVTSPHRMSEEELMRHAFNIERGALEDSSSFLSIVNTSMHAVMSQAYITAPTTYQLWTSTGSNSDFKASTRYRMSASGDMKLIPENGEFQNETVTDEGVSTKIATYGKKFGFGRQTIVNDNLGTVAKAIAAQVRSVQRFKNKKCYELLCSKNKIYDSEQLFCPKHKNLLTASALSVEALNEMIVTMAKQQDISEKETLNITPKYLIVPVSLQMAANRLIESASDPSGANSGVYNPMRKRFSVISVATIDTLSNKGFYAAADPMDIDTIEVTYLNGNAQPMLESNITFDQLGVQYRMYHDFGITVLDYRGLTYNPG